MTHQPQPTANNDGEAAVAVLLWAPAIIALLGLIALAVADHHTKALTQNTAEAAARAAAHAPDPAQAQRAALQTIDSTLTGQDLECNPTIDTTDWDTGQVHVTLTCHNQAPWTGLAPNPSATRTWTATVDNARITRTQPGP